MVAVSADFLSSIVNSTVLKDEDVEGNDKTFAKDEVKEEFDPWSMILDYDNNKVFKDEFDLSSIIVDDNIKKDEQHEGVDFSPSNNDFENDDFIGKLPHITGSYEDAFRYGHPYLPTAEMVKVVDDYWNADNRKQKYLGHFCGNTAISAFVSSNIDATACVGYLRSHATAFGYPGLKSLAEMCLSTSTNYSFFVDKQQMMAATLPEELKRRPSSIQQVSETCQVYKKLADKNTMCVTMDWSDASKNINYDYCRKVCLLQNLIVAILLPAYSMDAVLDVGGELERCVLTTTTANQQYEEEQQKRDTFYDLCVLSALSNLYTLFSGDGKDNKTIHLYYAPLRLPPFDDHPVINLKECPYFNSCMRNNIVASISTPSQSMVTLNHRFQRMPSREVKEEDKNNNIKSKLIGITKSGIEVRVLREKVATQNKRKKREVKYSVLAQSLGNITRDPVTHIDGRERPLFLRSMLVLCGSYGWFSMVLGYIATLDVLFMSNDHDGLFSPHWIRRFRKSYTSMTPLRNRKMDMRFNGLELVDTPGSACAFRIRPASMCNSNNMYETSPSNTNAEWTANVLQGTRNPFFTRLYDSKWYNPTCMNDIFYGQQITMEQHVAVFDNCLDKFRVLLEKSPDGNRWKANLRDKRMVFNKCILNFIIFLKFFCHRLEKAHGDFTTSTIFKSVRTTRGQRAQLICRGVEQRRKLCSNLERSLVSAIRFNRIFEYSGNVYRTVKKMKRRTKRNKKWTQRMASSVIDALSACFMLYDECTKNKTRFQEAEVRETAYEMVRELYRVSARLHVRDLLIRGTKMSLTWQRPYDSAAESTMSNVPRCRVPRIMYRYENRSDEERMTSLQILETRDHVYRPMRHTLLQMMFGEDVAKDISVVTSIQWMDWCRRSTVNPDAYYFDVHKVVESRKAHHNSSRFCSSSQETCTEGKINNRSRTDVAEGGKEKRNIGDVVKQPEKQIAGMTDVEIINHWLEQDTSSLPYGPMQGNTTNSHGEKKRHIDDDDKAVKKQKVPEVGGDFVSYDTSDEDDNVVSNDGNIKRKVHKNNKRNTGRMGFRDIYMICLVSLPSVINERCKKAISKLGFETDFLPNSK